MSFGIEVKRLKARLNLAELDFEDAKRDMGEAEQSFVEINMDALKIEVKRLKARLNLAELDFEDAKRDMGEAEQSFVEINMDGELGYGGMH